MVEGRHCRRLGQDRTSFWVRHGRCEKFAAPWAFTHSIPATPPRRQHHIQLGQLRRSPDMGHCFLGDGSALWLRMTGPEEPARRLVFATCGLPFQQPRLPDSRHGGGWRAAPAARERTSQCSCAFSDITLADVPLARADHMVKPGARLSRGCTGAWEWRHTGLEPSR